jgi:hypothetical protein
MKKFCFCILTALGFIPFAGFAVTFQIHGSQCETEATVTRDQFGISTGVPPNMGLTGNGKVNIRCPFTIDTVTRPTSAWLVVKAYDRHPNIDVSCTLGVVDSAGTLFGIASGNTTNSGAGQQIFQVGGPINLGAALTTKYPYVTCSIPQSFNGQRSHIVAIDLNLIN